VGEIDVARVALLLEYWGTKFHGSQYQRDTRTVQSVLESSLSTILREPIRAIFSGRTDSGVHARGQVAHFDTTTEDLDLWRFTWGLNGILPHDLSAKSAQIVPASFHARHSASARQYVYRVLNRPQRSALMADTHYFISYQLNYEAMSEAVKILVGSHDFASFKSSNSDRGTTRCNVTRAELLNLGEGQLELWIEANHFVYNMVRIIAGTLVEIGLGTRPTSSLEGALDKCDRTLAGPTAPAWALELNSVTYPERFHLFQTDARKTSGKYC
jgi:tRNA pseudouridine38-40 synthase